MFLNRDLVIAENFSVSNFFGFIRLTTVGKSPSMDFRIWGRTKSTNRYYVIKSNFKSFFRLRRPFLMLKKAVSGNSTFESQLNLTATVSTLKMRI